MVENATQIQSEIKINAITRAKIQENFKCVKRLFQQKKTFATKTFTSKTVLKNSNNKIKQ